MTGCSLAKADELRRSLEKDRKFVEKFFFIFFIVSFYFCFSAL
jgi:hypothetical protein